MDRGLDKKALITFYAITLPVSFLIETLYIFDGNELWMSLLMWIPGIVGIICAKKFYPKQKALGLLSKVKPLYIILGIIIPVIYLVPSYLISWGILKDPTKGIDSLPASALGEMGVSIPGIIFVIVSFVPMIFISAMTAAGEEIGWRGFAYPVLERTFGPVKAVLINGLIWALWHVPMIIGGVYQSQVNYVYGVIMFIVEVMIITVLFCWTRSVSGSVIPAILLHSVHNLVDQIYLQPLSTNDKVPYFAGEQGFITILFGAVIVAVIILRWRKTRTA